MTDQNVPTAAILIIGNEILSGQTQDKNAPFLSQKLAKHGIVVQECRTVRDEEKDIVEALNALRHKYTYVFTTGGIGPTHDDVTASAVAKAFNQKIIRNTEAEALFIKYLQITSTDDPRLKMANIPEGASLISNPVTIAPGFQIKNVFVLAGVPDIMQGMFKSLAPHLQKGPQQFTRTAFCQIVENQIAIPLAEIQHNHPAVEIGSYPSWQKEEERGVKLVFKGFDSDKVEQAFQQLTKYAHDAAIPVKIITETEI